MMQIYLDIAIKAARIAGNSIKDELATAKVNTAYGKDIKLQTDLESEKVVFDVLKRESSLDILSEESGFIKGSDTSSLRWIVDPLDGSLNFSRGIPLFCISIALWDGDKPVLGVIYDFNTDQLYSGIIGQGAWCNNRPIGVSAIEQKKNAIICTGFPVYSSFESQALQDFILDIQEYKKVRLLGSAAMSLALVSKGAADVYSENNIALWDVAAGIALVHAAGGDSSFQYTNKEKNLLYVKVTNGKLM